ncbi:MAG TPA: hypothetical protein VIG80_09235, partial [Bacillaceae bacterium]
QRGVGFYQFMNRHGKRSSAAYAFIAPLEKDPRLTVRLVQSGGLSGTILLFSKNSVPKRGLGEADLKKETDLNSGRRPL